VYRIVEIVRNYTDPIALMGIVSRVLQISSGRRIIRSTGELFLIELSRH